MPDDHDNTQAPVQVRVLYFEGCPNHPPTAQRIRSVAERLDMALDLKEIEVRPDDNPHPLGFRGSPTVQINDVDLDPTQRGQDNCGFGCRTYGGTGLPDEAMIEAALTDPPAPDPNNRRSTAFGEDHPDQQGGTDCCSTRGAGALTAKTTRSARTGMSSSIAAFGSAVVASACCWLPLLLVGFGLSLSLGGLIGTIEVLRPYLLIIAGLCLATGFYLVYSRPGPRRPMQQTALWAALVAVVAMAMFPYYSGALFGAGSTSNTGSTAGPPVVPAEVNTGDVTTVTYRVKGMTCGGCEAAVCSAMRDVPGVEQCRASYEKGRAWATVTNGELKPDTLVNAIEDVGFKAERIKQ